MSNTVYNSLKLELNKGKKAVVVTFIDDTNSMRKLLHNKIIITEEQVLDSKSIYDLDEMTFNKVQFAFNTGNLQFLRSSNGENILIEPYFPQPRLIVLGGGNIAKPLVEFGYKVGLSVTIVDDRPKFANKERFPNAENVICESFNNCFTQLNLNDYSFIVIVTREHCNDLDCLKHLLKYNTAYIGMIGSNYSVNSIKKQLLDEGYSEELINKINAPVGLKIGAITPEEIAISIIAQIIRHRRLEMKLSDNNADSILINWPEIDNSVLEELCKNSQDLKALITIISTKGSVPRKAGTKMLVWSYGMTMGSIGGGYAEGEIINAAWQIIGSGSTKIHDIDMTGHIAEEEGMICGGIMKVLIEDYKG
ncbi:XdhC family protein [Anaerovorax odorimutans]|uniref:XdhC family protein n=1 Tax=Anaerovorax odorimutans TaxID=109327 RepID=UPI00041DF608|nr:XdhC/CoxI family protein [Anaerovorax odorimutans]